MSDAEEELIHAWEEAIIVTATGKKVEDAG